MAGQARHSPYRLPRPWRLGMPVEWPGSSAHCENRLQSWSWFTTTTNKRVQYDRVDDERACESERATNRMQVVFCDTGVELILFACSLSSHLISSQLNSTVSSMSLPSSLDLSSISQQWTIDEATNLASRMMAFIERYAWLLNMHLPRYFLDRCWERVPLDWQTYLLSPAACASTAPYDVLPLQDLCAVIAAVRVAGAGAFVSR